MPILFRCACGASYQLKDETAGLLLHCPRCGTPSRVGSSTEPSPGFPLGGTEPSPPAAASLEPEGALRRAHVGDIPAITDEMLAAPQAADARLDFEKGMSLSPKLTILLLTANVLVFLTVLAKGALESREGVILAGALVREQVLAGEVWRFVSAMFLHAGFGHLIGNCLVLYILGMACEHAYGLPRLAAVYFAAGLGGAVASTVMNPGPSVGASGAIFGLMGAAIVFFRRYERHFILRDKRVGIVLIVWAAYSILTAFADPYIDNAAHVGGLLAGAGLAWGLRPALLDRVAHPSA